jgi:hypothetical protein
MGVPTSRRGKRATAGAGENLFPPAAAVIVAAALHTLLPDALQLLVTLVIVARAVGAIQ